MKLYSYFRSSAAYRARIALNLKGLAYEYLPIYPLRDGGQQLKPEYRAVNPDGIVPTLVDGDEVLHQSLAIIEYLEETHPQPPLLARRARRPRVRALDRAAGRARDSSARQSARPQVFEARSQGSPTT